MNVGIVGFGRIGNEHAGWLASANGIQAMAAADPTPARLALAESRGLRAFDRVELMLADTSIDVALISTPTSMHFDHAMLAIRAGKHVMIEKPMALNFEQAQRLAGAAAGSKRVLSVFHNRRWDRDYLTVKSAILSGAFGRIINVESRLGQWSSCVGPAAREWHPSWRNEAEFGGGGLYDWGSHFVDQIWQLMLPAKPIRVFAQLRGNVWTRDCDDFARLCIDFDNDAVAMVEINTTTTRPLPRWHIDGTRGSGDSPFSLSFDTTEWARLSYQDANFGAPRGIPPADPGLTEPQIWEQFASECRGDGRAAVSVKSVLATMYLLDAARKSAALGQAVRIESREIFGD
jgi:predicted dehydrogenase